MHGVRLASEILNRYRELAPAAMTTLFDGIGTEFGADSATVKRAALAYSNEQSAATLLALQQAVEPPRQELFRRLNLAPGGTASLVDLRRRLLQGLGEHPSWAGTDADLAHLFRSWFNAGFLSLQQIDWRTSALVLERLIQYEAVHQIQGWRDLRRRLAADRRCYAFFHSALPDEPLIFIEVALTSGMSALVQPLLDPDSPVLDPADAKCAIFYSITNCQEGLRGISFGNFLIKSVAKDLGRRLPQLRTFATLSPIPGFVSWLASRSAAEVIGARSAKLQELLDQSQTGTSMPGSEELLALRPEIIRACAGYLMCAKQGGAPLDPVARFHLANGARLERLNWLADTSANGVRRALSMMANYVYRIADVERNQEMYARDYRVMASRDLQWIVRPLRSTTSGRQRDLGTQ
jgi:malonyl-CoA decarboxylase